MRDVREAILRRRHRFVAAALTALAAGVLLAAVHGVVAIDLLRPGRDARRAQPPWPRLSLRAERAGSVLLVSGERPEVGTFAATVLGLRRDAAGWVGGGPSPLLLERLDVRIDVLRSKVGGVAGPVRWASSSARRRSTDAA